MIQELIKVERIHYLYHSAKLGSFFNVCLALLITLFLWDRVENSELICWLTVICIISLIRFAETLRFLRKKDIDEDNVQPWLYRFIFFSTLSGFTWGISIWFFAPYNDIALPIFVAYILGGITAGAASVLAPVLIVYISYVVATLSPVLFWFLLDSSGDYRYIAIMLFTYMIMLIMTGNMYRRVLLKSIFLAHEIKKEKEASERANKAKSEFLSSMSHELRTPLNAVLGFSQLLKMEQEPALSEQQKQHVEFILNSGEHLLSLIDDVLELSRIESGNMKLNIKQVLLDDVVSDCTAFVKNSAQEKNITIDVEQARTDYYVQCDKTKLKQIILNLLSNAIKYNKPQGNVTISTTRVNEDIISIEVHDTGIGISAENREKVFKPFERLGQQRSNIEGTGIGLYISKQAVEMMNGRVFFTSELNKGTTFTLYLPASPRATI